MKNLKDNRDKLVEGGMRFMEKTCNELEIDPKPRQRNCSKKKMPGVECEDASALVSITQQK